MLSSHKSGRCAVELYHASHLWHPPVYTSPMASSALQHWTTSLTKEGCHWQAGGENRQTWQLANPAWYPSPTIATTDIQEAAVTDLQPGSGGQLSPNVRPHNQATRFWPSLATVFSTELFCTEHAHCGACKEMATYRHWSVSLWRDPDDVSHCWILSPDKTEWWFISATLCGWRRCFVADQLWVMTRIREEEEPGGFRIDSRCLLMSCWSGQNCSHAVDKIVW